MSSGEQDKKPKPTRSSHAKQRQAEGRPVSEGFGDARKARRSEVFIDVRKDYYVVRVAKTREHIFAKDGTQATSVNRMY